LVRISAIVVPDPRREARVQMLKENPDLVNMYNPDDGLLEVMYLKDATATFASHEGEPIKIVKF
jgi:uncharacterized pyridoxamine 5'-phosphate oxidase family protein